MILSRAFVLLHRNLVVLIYPILLDLTALYMGWSFIDLSSPSKLSLRVILEMGLPSVSHLVSTPPTWIAVMFMLLVSTFAQGGFIGGLFSMAKSEELGFSQFVIDGRKYWLRFIFLNTIVLLAKIAVTSLLIVLFGIIGVSAAFIFFVVLRILYIYLEFTMVIDNLNMDTALRKCRQYWKLDVPKTIVLISILFLVSGSVSVLIHWYWTPGVIVSGIFLYAYLMTWIQLAFMLVLYETREQNARFMFYD